MSEPSADAGDAEPVPAQEKDLDQQLQPQGQAVGEAGGSPPTEEEGADRADRGGGRGAHGGRGVTPRRDRRRTGRLDRQWLER